MANFIDFDAIKFEPTTRMLSIEYQNNIVEGGGPFDLRTTGVMLGLKQIVREIEITSSSKANTDSVFTTENFVLEMDFDGKDGGSDHRAKMIFGELQSSVGGQLIDGKTTATANKFHLLWIGSDDIRVNFSNPRPSGILLMEGEEMSFEIVTKNEQDYLFIRYHV